MILVKMILRDGKRTISTGFHKHENIKYKAKDLFVMIQQCHGPQRPPGGDPLCYQSLPRVRATV